MTSRRLLALLCAAVLGVLVVVGLAVTALLGVVGGIVYGVVALGGSASVLSALAVRGRSVPAVMDAVPHMLGDLPKPAPADLTLAS